MLKKPVRLTLRAGHAPIRPRSARRGRVVRDLVEGHGYIRICRGPGGLTVSVGLRVRTSATWMSLSRDSLVSEPYWVLFLGGCVAGGCRHGWFEASAVVGLDLDRGSVAHVGRSARHLRITSLP